MSEKVTEVPKSRPCIMSGCAGTQTYAEQRNPGFHEGTPAGGGAINWNVEKRAGWICNKNEEHWSPD